MPNTGALAPQLSRKAESEMVALHVGTGPGPTPCPRHRGGVRFLSRLRSLAVTSSVPQAASFGSESLWPVIVARYSESLNGDKTRDPLRGGLGV
jgi:hypothetical protein